MRIGINIKVTLKLPEEKVSEVILLSPHTEGIEKIALAKEKGCKFHYTSDPNIQH